MLHKERLRIEKNSIKTSFCTAYLAYKIGGRDAVKDAEYELSCAFNLARKSSNKLELLPYYITLANEYDFMYLLENAIRILTYELQVLEVKNKLSV